MLQISFPSPKFVPLANFTAYCCSLLASLWNTSVPSNQNWVWHEQEMLPFNARFFNNSLDIIFIPIQNAILMLQGTFFGIVWLLIVDWRIVFEIEFSIVYESRKFVVWPGAANIFFNTSSPKFVPFKSHNKINKPAALQSIKSHSLQCLAGLWVLYSIPGQ